MYGFRQNSVGTGVPASRTPPEKTTCPFGTSVALEKLAPAGVEFEYVSATGSNMPTFADATDGAKMTFPEGVRHPPPKKAGGTVTFEEENVLGLMTSTFEFCGTPMTFPFGVSTNPLKPSVPTDKLDPARVTGLY